MNPRPIISRAAVRRIFRETCGDFHVYRLHVRSGFFDELNKHVERIVRQQAASAAATRQGKAIKKKEGGK